MIYFCTPPPPPSPHPPSPPPPLKTPLLPLLPCLFWPLFPLSLSLSLLCRVYLYLLYFRGQMEIASHLRKNADGYTHTHTRGHARAYAHTRRGTRCRCVPSVRGRPRRQSDRQQGLARGQWAPFCPRQPPLSSGSLCLTSNIADHTLDAKPRTGGCARAPSSWFHPAPARLVRPLV